MIPRNIIFITTAMTIIITHASPSHAISGCDTVTKQYTACKPGYYLTSNQCLPCPGNGTSADKNQGSISVCYLPTGSSCSDNTGTCTYTRPCYYSK